MLELAIVLEFKLEFVVKGNFDFLDEVELNKFLRNVRFEPIIKNVEKALIGGSIKHKIHTK